jgi:hypothetical protein
MKVAPLVSLLILGTFLPKLGMAHDPMAPEYWPDDIPGRPG